MAGYIDPLDGLLPGTTGQVDANAAGAAGDAGFATGTGTGRFGIVPHPTGNGGMIATTVTSMWHWLKTPISTPMSPMSIFTVIGIVLVGILAWNLLLYHIRIAAESI